MARLLPSTPDLSAAEEAGPRVIGIEGDDADELLAALSSGTARRLLATLHEEPAPPSEVADRVGTSLQNAQYHLGKLEDAGIVEVIDTIYSEKGREMKVYAPSDKPLVVVAGGEGETASLKRRLASLFGGLGLVALVGVLLQYLTGGFEAAADGAEPEAAAGADGGVSVAEVGTPTPAPAQAPGGLPIELLGEPGVLFFAGGAAVLLIGFAIWYARSYR